MNIVIVLDHAHVNGGQAKVALDSAKGFARRGARVTVFAAVGPVDPSLLDAGIEVVCLGQTELVKAPLIKGVVQGIWNDPARRALGELLARLPAGDTVVHIHGWAKALSPSIAPAIAASGHPGVYTMHEYFLFCPNGGFYVYPRNEICRRTPMSLSCVTTNCDARSLPHKAWRLARQVAVDHMSRLARCARHVITISAMQEDIVGALLPPGSVVHRVANPIAVPDMGPKERAGRAFLFVGRLSPEKGVAIFAEAARRLGVRPVIVGGGPAAGELARDYPEAEMLGWKSAQEILPIMREARALVFPSVWYEGQPLTVYEALATGTPVIVSDVCAGREAVEHGVNGLWFKSGDPAALAEAMTVLGDEAAADAMTARAHARYWQAPLTLDRHLDGVTRVYEAALAGARRTSSVTADAVEAATA
ncbi:glycosyltransferase family 4 protein [Chelatococcus sp. SYSU_G07232]|uniref:Glycosyltransferase family 4 protein n=1 Tax=Chelatococcus albus TaxID=3047466 RepID=A0ABT7AC21_9HYPH|nr:glycosyltransferase family 4 protein [Chelatococcus sp. SYSU_G07232]MDJ1156918.1 glycosyltransferase family 4 protein [Chelatococcus sp. SYSU_G07232]